MLNLPFPQEHEALADSGVHVNDGIAKNVLPLGPMAAQIASRSVSDRTTRLERALEKARASARAKSEFFAKVSHEVRTPLNGMIGLTRLLGRTSLDEEQERLLRLIERSGEMLLSIVNEVLDFSEIEARRVEPHHRSFDLRQLLTEVCEIHRATAADRGIALSCEIAPEVSERIRTDPRRLAQILHNLLSNSLKFTEEGRILVRVLGCPVGEPGEHPRYGLRFEVEDTGIGVPADDSDRVFQAFSRLDPPSRLRHCAGTGLGLAIVKELVELLGGSVGVHQARVRGSVFWFWIPDPGSETDGRSSAELQAATRNGFRFTAGTSSLVVDDNEVNRLVAFSTLKKLGADVTVVEGGAEALKAFGKNHYDLVFLDCQMPAMDGFECARRLRQLDKGARVAIIAFTAHATEGDRQRCLAAGMDDCVAKPLRVEDLVALLQRLSTRSSSVAEQ